MSNQPNPTPNNQVAEKTDDRGFVVTKQEFSLWLENELAGLEEQFKDFATTKSTREFFSR